MAMIRRCAQPSFGPAYRSAEAPVSLDPVNVDPGPQPGGTQVDGLPVSEEDRLTFRARQVFIFGQIDERIARESCRRLLALAEVSAAPITCFISSPGGHVESGDVIHDIVRFIPAPVTMIGTGWVASAAAHIFLAAPRERRLCLPNTRFMIHQPAGGIGGRASDIAIQAEQALRIRDRIARVIAEQTGQPLERVLADIDRDRWMQPQEAIAYGLVGRVVSRREDLA